MAAGSQEACHDPVIALVGDLLVTNLDPALLALADDQDDLEPGAVARPLLDGRGDGLGPVEDDRDVQIGIGHLAQHLPADAVGSFRAFIVAGDDEPIHPVLGGLDDSLAAVDGLVAR